MKYIFSKTAPVWLGMSFGTLASLIFGWVYIVVLHEPGSAFYLFAGLTYLGGSLIGGIVAVRKAQVYKRKAFFAASSAVFGMAFGLFVFVYVVLPQFERVSVQLPAFCDGLNGSFNPPAHLAYTLPEVGTGILLTSDAQSALVAVIDYAHSPSPSTVFLVNKSNDQIIQSWGFNNDVISATIVDGTLYLYNDKLGALIDARTGEYEQSFLLIDNYGGLSETDRPFISRASSGHWYMETTAIISSWNMDGTVKSRPDLTLNGIARGCFIAGDTHEITPLK